MSPFKMTIKKILRERKFLTVLILLVFFLFVFVLSGFSVYYSLKISNEANSQNRMDYTYYLNQKSKTENDGDQNYGFNPLAVFSDETVTIGSNSFSTLSIRNGENFLFSYDGVKDNVINKINNKKTIDIFSFYFRKNVSKTFFSMFQETKNYQLYSWYINSFVDYWNDKQKTADEITNLLFESVFADANKDGVADTNIKTADNINITTTVSSTAEYVKNDTQLFEIPSGQAFDHIGLPVHWTTKKPNDDASQQLVFNFDYYFIYEPSSDYFLPTSNSSGNVLNYSDKDLYNDKNSSWFNNVKKYLNLDFRNAYINEFAIRNHFTYHYYNQWIYSNYVTNDKYLLVDWSERFLPDNEENLNAVSLKITTPDPAGEDDLYFGKTIILSNRYAQRNKIQINDTIQFKANRDFELTVGAMGYERNNIYPLIFSSDYFPDTVTEATLFVNYNLLTNSSYIPYNFLSDVSKALFNYEGHNLNADLNNFQKEIKLNPFNADNEVIMQKNNELSVILKANALQKFDNYFLYAFMIILVITLIITFSAIAVLIKRDTVSKKDQHGILKASGVLNREIANEYGLMVLIPILIASIVSYPFIILLQYVFLKIVQPYFEINFHINSFILWFIVATILFSLLSYVISFLFAINQLKQRAVDMMEKNEIKKVTLGMKIVDSLKIKTFSRRFALKQFTISWKKMIVMAIILFLSSFSLTLLVSLPNEVKTIKNKYFETFNYTESSEYADVVTNVPMARYTTYDDYEETNLIFPDAYVLKNSDDKTPIPFTAMSDKDATTSMQDSLLFSFLALRNKHFSIGTINKILNQFKNSSEKYSALSQVIEQIMTTIVPKVFNSSGNLIGNSWQEKISNLVAKEMPPELLQYWNDNEIRKKFSFDFLTTQYDKRTDELTTTVRGDDATLVGLNKNATLIDVDTKSLNNNEAIISKSLAVKKHLHIGDEYEYKYYVPTLLFYSKTGYQKVPENNFVYVDAWNGNTPKSETAVSKTDLSHYTYENIDRPYDESSDERIGQGTPYYYDANGHLKPFYKLQNVYLKLNKNTFDQNTFQGTKANVLGYKNSKGDQLFDSYGTKNYDEYIYIPIYDWGYEKAKAIHTLADILAMNGQIPQNWFQDALQVRNAEGKTFLKIDNLAQKKVFKIAKVAKIYDRSSLYVKRQVANEMLFQNDLSYFNGMMSSSKMQKDVLMHVAFTKSDSDYSINALGSMANQNKNTDMMLNKLDVLNEFYNLILELAIIFIIIIVVLSLIIIGMITSQFIRQFAKAIFTLKIMGYSNKEIQGIMLRIMLPFSILAVLLGVVFTILSFVIIELTIEKHGLALPIVISWPLVIGSMIVIFMLFGCIYTYNYRLIISSSIQKNIIF